MPPLLTISDRMLRKLVQSDRADLLDRVVPLDPPVRHQPTIKSAAWWRRFMPGCQIYYPIPPNTYGTSY